MTRLLSVVIDDLNIVSIAIREAKTNAPAVVDADAPLPGAIALQRFEVVGRRQPQVVDPYCRRQLQESHGCPFVYLTGQAARSVCLEKCFRLGIGKRFDHGGFRVDGINYKQFVYGVKSFDERVS